MKTKLFYSIQEVSDITKIPPSLIMHYIRVKDKTICPEQYPDINPKRVKGEYMFTKRDIDELFRFIDKKNDESWEKWQLRLIKESMAKKNLKQVSHTLPRLKVIKGKKYKNKDKDKNTD